MANLITVFDKIDVLPFLDILTWERFQLFCTDLLYKTYNSIDSRDYLSQGSKQDGIDIYAIQRNSDKITVAQCKLKKFLGPSHFTEIIDTFLKGSFVDVTSEFILCTNTSLEKKKVETAIAQGRQKLGKYDIELIIWDEKGIARELRTNPSPNILEIVYHYFDAAVCRAFFGDKWDVHIQKLHPVNKRLYKAPQDYIERDVISYDERLSNPGQDRWRFWDPTHIKKTLINVLENREEGDSPKIVLLSTAGFGKSEELQMLAAHFSKQTAKFYPVKFSLGNYSGETIEQILLTWDDHWKNLSPENLLLVFDGVDEIEAPFLSSFFKRMNAFMELYPKTAAVVSSRFNFYDVAHQPLKDFEIYLLDTLTQADIELYLVKQLPNKKDEFIELLQDRKFYEYISNPYYLTRLVRFFKDDIKTFPRNKTELFERILFEQLTKDQGKYNIPELKNNLFLVAKRIAFCMTLSGKSSLTDDELNTIISDPEMRKSLNHFCILNRNESRLGAWAFEHKNLQEYLCASAFIETPFVELQKIISYAQDANKLLPRFLNTVSFLFELLDNNHSLFRQLFDWINSNEPELLVRFEKEQISKDTRNKIFYQLFNAYKSKGISLRASNNFSLQDLARFVEVDENIVDYLTSFLTPDLPLALSHDVMSIMSMTPRPYTLKTKLLAFLLAVLRDPGYAMDLRDTCIRTFGYFGFTEQETFNQILQSGVNLEDQRIRRSCLVFLEHTDYAEVYATFIIESILVLDKNQEHTNERIKRLMVHFNSPSTIKEVLRFCISDKSAVSVYPIQRKFQFELHEFKAIMVKALTIYGTDKSILKIVYRLYCSINYVHSEEHWHHVFLEFFQNTCGNRVIFDKFYRYDKTGRELLAFADESCCDFLIDEYLQGRIGEQQMVVYRNVLSHINWPLFKYFYDRLISLPNGDKFFIDDLITDYNQLRKTQEEKNQQMLLDRDLFLEEAAIIFSILKKDKVKGRDLWISDNKQLRPYQHSLAFQTIRDRCIHEDDKQITPGRFYKSFQKDEDWQSFVIDEIKQLLEKDNPKALVHPELMDLIKKWCYDTVDAMDFKKHCIVDNIDGGYTYFNNVLYFMHIVLLLDLDFSDSQLLKFLLADHTSFYKMEQTEKSIMSIILSQMKDRELLRKAVIANLKNEGLSFRIRATHFRICQLEGYKECLPPLFQMITAHPLLPGYERIKLSEIYCSLGGQLIDFAEQLSVPANVTEERSYVDWQWYLIEKLLHSQSQKVTIILLEIIENDAVVTNKLKAAEFLIRLGNIEGLRFWLFNIKQNSNFGFESKWASMYDATRVLPFPETADIFFEALEIYLNGQTAGGFSGIRNADESVYSNLSNLAIQCPENYNYIKQQLALLTNRLNPNVSLDSLKHFTERLTHNYFESISQHIDIGQAALLYDNHLEVLFNGKSE